MDKSRKVAYYGILAALAILLSYVERLIPIPVGIPGIKLGLANVVVLIALYYMGSKPAINISIIRIIIAGLLFNGFAGFLYSMSGAVLSFLAMWLLNKTDKVSITGVSVVGGIFHNIGQVAMACYVMKTPKLVIYLPPLLIAGIVTGVLTGTAAKYTLQYLKNQ